MPGLLHRTSLTLFAVSLLASPAYAAKSKAKSAAHKAASTKETPTPAVVPASASIPEADPPPSAAQPAPPAPKASASRATEPAKRAEVVLAAPAIANSKLVFDRIGVGADLFMDGGGRSGEQWINNTRQDESLDYTLNGISGTAYLLFRTSDRFRFGPGFRYLGQYGPQQPSYNYGTLTEIFVALEYSLRVVEKFDAVFGGRFGPSVLFPGGDFEDEIRFRRAEGADLWNVPRLGAMGGINVGVRRVLVGNLYAKLDFTGQLTHQWLFATDQIVDGLRFRKYWSNDIRRLGLTLAFEVAF